MKVLIIANYCTLEGEIGSCRFPYLADVFACHGHKVTLMTSSFYHRDKKQRNREYLDKHRSKHYELELVHEPAYSHHLGIQRIMSHHRFGKNIERRLESMEDLPDLIYYSFPTFSAAEAAIRFANKHQIPTIVDIIDIWPEALRSVLRFPDLLFKGAFSLFTIRANHIYKNANALIGVSETYVKRAKRVNPKNPNLPIYLGADLSYFDNCPHSRLKNNDEIWLIYIGTISYSYDIGTLIRALHILVHQKGITNIRAKIVGGGPHLNKFKKMAATLNVPADFTGFVSYEIMTDYLKNADIAVNAIVKGAQQSITYKIGDFVSAGLPIVNGSENPEFREIVMREKLGVNYQTGNETDLSNKLLELIDDPVTRKLYASNSRRFAELRFDKRITYKEIVALAEHLLTKKQNQPEILEEEQLAF